MVRMRSPARSRSCGEDFRSLVLAGAVGSGAGLAADVLADVVRLGHGRVRRRRRLIVADAARVVLERLEIERPGKRRHRTATNPTPCVDLAVAWDDAGVAAIGGDAPLVARWIGRRPNEAAPFVPDWRRDLPTSSDPSGENAGAIPATVRLLAHVSRCLPYGAELWRRTIALHVPPRHRRRAIDHFDAALGEPAAS